MMALHDFPRCSAYLKGMKYRLNDPSMTEYGWAVCLSEKWTDEELVEDGRVNFDTMDGTSILVEFERLLRDGLPRAPRVEVPAKLASFIGSRGVKTNRLSVNDWWPVASILWPSVIAGKSGTLDDLCALIAGMTKDQRKEANENRRKVPVKWRA